jgi:hypothetical protein
VHSVLRQLLTSASWFRRIALPVAAAFGGAHVALVVVFQLVDNVFGTFGPLHLSTISLVASRILFPFRFGAVTAIVDVSLA